MERMKDTYHVWLGIIYMASEICKYAAATQAYENTKAHISLLPKEQANFFEVAASAIWNQLLLDISKIFERARTCGNENCSVDMLKELCLNSNVFTTQESQKIDSKIQKLCAEYDKIISKEARNKYIAHYDLYTVLNDNEFDISFAEIRPFIKEVTDFLTEISSKFLRDNARLVFYPLDKSVQEFETAILSMIKQQ